MTEGEWGDSTLLKKLPNPSSSAYEVEINCPELTFLGVFNQPDFAHLRIIVHHGEWIIELKSLKEYLGAFRDSVMSYERLINVIYDDITEKYGPQRLRLEMDCNARGGISSKLKIDSDWKVRGGQELYQNWKE